MRKNNNDPGPQSLLYRELGSTCIILLITAGSALLIDLLNWNEILHYRRQYVFEGQWWRLWSSHFTHSNRIHLWLNLGALLAMGLYARNTLSVSQWLLSLAICTTVVGLCLLVLPPWAGWYTGLSGVLHGLMVVIAIRVWVLRHEFSAVLVLAGLAVKISWEQFSGTDTATAQLIASPVYTISHLYGIVGGLLTVPFMKLLPRST